MGPPGVRSAFVGRTRELGVLGTALAASRAGAGRVVLLVGPPGIGKSRLADAFARQAAEAGGEVLSGRCFEGPGAPPFWPWVQIVRAYAANRDAATLAAELGTGAVDVAAVVPSLHRLLPGLDTPPREGQEQARFRFFDALTATLRRAAERRPITILVDDLHGADPSSLLLLQFLARELHTAGVVVVGTLRGVAFAPGHPLADTLGELVREQVSEQLELVGLEVTEVAELMAQLGGSAPPPALVEAVHRRTEGNPLYVTEVVRMLLGQGGFDAAGDRVAIPATVRAAIGRHLGGLSPEAHDTLTLAALFGREFQADVVARAGAFPITAVLSHVDEAVAARLAAAQPAEPRRYRFAHALFGETLVEALGEVRRIWAPERDAGIGRRGAGWWARV